MSETSPALSRPSKKDLIKQVAALREKVDSALQENEEGREIRPIIERELAEAKARVVEVTGLLHRLADLQNGPPLPKYEDEYNALMPDVWEALAGEKKEGG